mmetsp:Transcript_29171/g.88435  ORF Transcript_29171/g.88435 Transcript_29171/m.88435 type:complete len:224 (-) Transcript_29171:27-698(-)
MDHGEAQQLHHHVEEADDGRLGRVLVGEVRLALAHRHDDVHRVDEEEDDAEGERGQRGDEGEDEVEDAVVARRPLAARRLGKEREAKLLGAVLQLVHQWGVLVHEVVVRGAERERHRLPCRLRVGEVVRRGVRKDGGRERVREPERRVQPPDDGAEGAPLEVEEGLDRRRLEDGAVACLQPSLSTPHCSRRRLEGDACRRSRWISGNLVEYRVVSCRRCLGSV